MKKEESLWQLLKRLDEQGGQFNLHLAAANRYFDYAATVTITLIARHERDMHTLFARLRSAMKSPLKKR